MHKLFLVSGPSGSGKTTIMHRVMDNEIVSITTRPMREGERDGYDYHFITQTEYEHLEETGQLVERSSYAGNHYGVTRSELGTKRSKGPAFVIVDHAGMQAMTRVCAYTVPICIYASDEACYLNMRDRGTDQDTILKRLSTYQAELDHRTDYDYVIRNIRGNLNHTVAIVRHIIAAESGT